MAAQLRMILPKMDGLIVPKRGKIFGSNMVKYHLPSFTIIYRCSKWMAYDELWLRDIPTWQAEGQRDRQFESWEDAWDACLFGSAMVASVASGYQSESVGTAVDSLVLFC